MEVSLNSESINFVTVPFLVTSENLEYSIFAILGTNAMEHLLAAYKTDELQHIYQGVYQTIHQKHLIH